MALLAQQKAYRSCGQEPAQLVHERDALGLNPRLVLGAEASVNAVIALYDEQVKKVWKQSYADYHTLTLHVGGAELCRVKGRRGTVEVGAPGSVSLQHCTDESLWTAAGRCRWMQIYVPVGLVAAIAEDVFEKPENKLAIDRATGLKDRLLLRRMYRMLASLHADTAPTAEEIDAWATDLTCLVLANHSNIHRRSESQGRERLSVAKYRQVAELIEDRLGSRIEISEMAQVAGMSIYHFCRAFKNLTDETPYQYVIGRRVEKAREMLETSSRSLAEIAYETGFSSQAHLTETFSRALGVPPGCYRHTVVQAWS